MRYGYSPAMRHLGRTHGVCLRWLSERFKESQTNLYYERSALQAADIYTKAFTVPAEWDRVLRLINVLDPPRFWEDRERTPQQHQMPDVHKGGVQFSYWTSNPWHGLGPRNLPKDPPASEAAACLARAAPALQTHVDQHEPWFVPPKGTPALACKVKDNDHGNAEYFEEAPDFDADEYASTAEPDSDEESLAESTGDEQLVPVAAGTAKVKLPP